MKVFVTGSTGLLGNNLVHMLVEQGHQVKAMVRSEKKASYLLKDLDVKIVKGDMLDVDGFASELEGCDVLFHTAAYLREYFQAGQHWKMLEDINVKGTLNLLSEAKKRGIQKVIYVSSAGVIGNKPDGSPGDETTLPHPFIEKDLYFKSKVVAEQAIRGFLERYSLPIVFILPGWIFGPGDAAPTSSGRFVLDYVNRKLPGIVDGGVCVIDARDTAQAMIKAVEKGESGERYIVGGTYFSMEDITKALEKVTSIPSPSFHIPYKIMMAYAIFCETYSKLTNQSVLISRTAVQSLHEKRQWNSDKVLTELGLNFRPLEETLYDEVEWYCKHDYIKSQSFKVISASLH